MNSTQSLAAWLNQIDANQQVFAGRGLDKTLLYLRNGRTPGEGWGAYPKLGSDLHHSALAIQALSYSGDSSSIGTIAGAASVLRKGKTDSLDQLGVDDLGDLIVIARAEQRPGDEAYVESLLNSLQRGYEALTPNEVSVRTLCSTLLAVLEIGRTDVEVIKRWIDQLLALQRPDGGWPPVAGQPSMLVATAMTLRVLTKSAKGSSTEALRRGLYFVQGEIEKNGWTLIGSGGDTFTQAIVLRALAEVPGADYKLIQDGVDSLIAKMNQDGSWGNAVGETGNIESTALSLLALIAAGENRFVPARLVTAALIDVKSQLDEITEERNQLREDFEKRVQDDCGEVVRQRNTLTKENQDLRGNVQAAQTELRKAIELKESAELRQQVLERELELTRLQRYDYISTLRTPTAVRGWRQVFVNMVFALPAVITAFVIWRFWKWPPSWFGIIEIILLFFGGLATSWFLFQRSRVSLLPRYFSEGASEYRLSSDLDSLRYMYMDMAGSWPAFIREEVAYRLLSDMVEMPTDVGLRYVEEMTFRLDMPSQERSQLSSWMRYALRLSPGERRILFDQLRRSTLK
ncbi:MAG TPA: hypothetical protein VGJ69_06340 [Pyrinomonadaceae bacterium]|jgi:hypothetical protein